MNLKSYTLSSLFFLIFTSILNAQNFTWANEISGASAEEPVALATDNEGNTIVAGIYTSPALTVGDITLTNSGDGQTAFEIFLIKYDAKGNVLWAKTAGGEEHDEVRGLASDQAGNIYMTGYYGAPATFDNVILDNTGNFTSQAFLVKYNSDGVLQWIKTSQFLQFNNYPSNLTADASGNLYIAGSGHLAELADINIFGLTHTDQGDYDGYVLKMDTDGNPIWLKEFWYDDNAGSNRNIEIHEIAVSNDGSRFCISGNFYGVFDFGGLIDTSRVFFTNTNQGIDIFMACYTAGGDLLWQDSPGGYEWGGTNEVHGIATDNDNNTYVTGKLGGIMYFDDGDSIAVNEVDFNDTELFLLKYDNNGNKQWTEHVYVQENIRKIEPADIAVSSDGNIYLTGYYQWNPVFGDIEPPFIQNGAFTVKYNTQGQAQWVKAETANIGSFGVGIDIDSDQNVYTTGYFTSFATFDNFDLQNGNLRGTFLTKISSTPTSTITPATDTKWSVFPNPANRQIHINLAFETGVATKLEIIDQLGKVVRSHSNIRQADALDIAKLPHGTYFLKLYQGEAFSIKKFIKL